MKYLSKELEQVTSILSLIRVKSNFIEYSSMDYTVYANYFSLCI